MARSLPNTTQEIQEKLKTLYTLIGEIEEARAYTEENLVKLREHEKQNPSDLPMNSSTRRTLKNIYKKSTDSAKQEITVIGAALEKIQQIRNVRKERRIQAKLAGNKEAIRRVTVMKMLRDSAAMLPLFIRITPQEEIPPLCGSVPAGSSYIAKAGDFVAALVETDGGEENWILAEVIQFNETTNKYEVDDVDADDNTRHVVSKRLCVPLPLMKVNPETEPEALYYKGTSVMALFPETTCFYPAVIDERPMTVHEDYKVAFEDSIYEEGFSVPMSVPQRFIITIPEIKSRGKTRRTK